MAERLLHVTIRTPRGIVHEGQARGVRVPCETGQVGLRPGAESCVLAIEAGLVLIRGEERTLFVGTAGGVLRCDGHWLTILTPLAVRGMEADSVVALLDQALAAAHEEAEIREALGKLEHRILHELRREPARLARGPKK